MLYPSYVLDEIRERADIVEVVSAHIGLKPRGANMVGLCPFHREKTPSFSVSPSKQLYYCFGCGVGGNVYNFIMQVENIGFADAVKRLAERTGYELPITTEDDKGHGQRQRLYELNLMAARFFRDNLLSSRGGIAREYLSSRRVSQKAQEVFGLGYAPNDSSLCKFMAKHASEDELITAGLIAKRQDVYDRFRNRLIFPIFDISGHVIGFGGRELGNGDIKYLNSPQTPVFDKSQQLYALNYAMKAAKKLKAASPLILVEGYMDVIALYQQGIKTVAAPLGTAFTAGQAGLFSRSLGKLFNEAIIMFDADQAGQKATQRAIDILSKQGIPHRIVTLPEKDPDEFIMRHGPLKLADKIENAQDSILYQIELAKQQYKLDKPAQKAAFLTAAAAIISKISDPIRRETYQAELAKLHNISEEAVKTATAAADEAISPYTAASPAIKQVSAVDEAIQRIFQAMLNPAFGKVILSQIDKAELYSEENLTYQKLFDIISRIYEQNKTKDLTTLEIPPAALMDYFDDEHERGRISDIFAKDMEYTDVTDQEKAINRCINIIKLEYLTKEMKLAFEKGDIGLGNALILQKIELEAKNRRF